MSKETLILIIGLIVFFVQFLGIPSEYKEWILITSGIVLVILGYNLRRKVFLASLHHPYHEHVEDVYKKSRISSTLEPVYKDSEHTL